MAQSGSPQTAIFSWSLAPLDQVLPIPIDILGADPIEATAANEVLEFPNGRQVGVNGLRVISPGVDLPGLQDAIIGKVNLAVSGVPIFPNTSRTGTCSFVCRAQACIGIELL